MISRENEKHSTRSQVTSVAGRRQIFGALGSLLPTTTTAAAFQAFLRTHSSCGGSKIRLQLFAGASQPGQPLTLRYIIARGIFPNHRKGH